MNNDKYLYLICSPNKWYGENSEENYKVNYLLYNLEESDWGVRKLKSIYIGMKGIIKVSGDTRPKYFLEEYNITKLESGIYAIFEVTEFIPDKQFGKIKIKVIKNLFKQSSIISKNDSRNILGKKFDSQSQGYLTQEQFNMVLEKIYISGFDDTPEVKKEPIQEVAIVYPRNKQYKKDALELANFKCELEPNHITFTSKFTNDNYVEGHHLIPMAKYETFNYSIDVKANIVSLCPTCHRMLHSGLREDINKAIKILYENRKDRLNSSGLNITLDELQNIYEEDI